MKSNFFIKIKKGFTLFELLLTISLVSMIAVFTVPVTGSFLNQNELDNAFRLVLTSIRKAQIYSITGRNDAIWGARLVTGSITVFSGTNYASRTIALDEISSFSTKVAVSGTSEMVFSKLNGELASASSLTLSNSFGTKTISVNTKGIANY